MSNASGFDPLVARATQKVLKLFLMIGDAEDESGAGKPLPCCVFSYGNHFDELWGSKFFSDYEAAGAFEKPVLLIWDGLPPPPGIINTSQYLTPLDWTVAFSLSIEQKCRTRKEPCPNLRILIVDLQSNNFKDAHSVRFFSQFPDFMPWVRVLEPGDGRHPFNIGNLLTGIMIKKDAATTGTTPLPEHYLPSMKEALENLSGRPTHMEMIRKIWSANITRPAEPGDHHAIANLMGPLLLLSELPDDHSHHRALRKLLTALEIIPRSTDDYYSLSDEKSWVDWERGAWKTRIEKIREILKKPLKLTLIDDQFIYGWGKFLCNALGCNKYEHPGSFNNGQYSGVNIGNISLGLNCLCELDASSSAEALFESLRDSLENGHLGKCRFNFPTDILFYDLRLYSGRDWESEKAFLKKVADLASNFMDEKSDQTETRNNQYELSWPGFSEQEIERFKKWIDDNPQREDPVYLSALTFLPRMISLSDHSLPIVIFSSTGRREIIDAFKPYRNIITDFEKPRIAGPIESDILWKTMDKFLNAFLKALRFTYARAVGKLLMSRKLPELPKGKYFEIFIDESGDLSDKNFLVGGICTISQEDYEGGFELQTNANRVSKINGFFENKGLVWYGNNALPKLDDPEKICDEINCSEMDNHNCNNKKKKECKDEAFQKQCGNIVTELNSIENPLRLFAFAIKADPKEVTSLQSDGLFGTEKQIDNLHRWMVASCIELILFDILPEMRAQNECEVHCGVFAATRQIVSELSNDPKFNEENVRFGTFMTNKDTNLKYRIRSFTEADVYHILVDILRWHKNKDKKNTCIKISFARGVRLQYLTSSNDKKFIWFRHPLYLADRFIRGCRKNIISNGNYENKFENFFECKQGGFECEYNAKLKDYLQASREIDCGYVNTAASLLIKHIGKAPPTVLPFLSIERRLGEQIARLKGNSWEEIVISLTQKDAIWREITVEDKPVTWETIRIKKRNKNTHLVLSNSVGSKKFREQRIVKKETIDEETYFILSFPKDYYDDVIGDLEKYGLTIS